ncbi:MAG: hypothetical protein V4492_00825 [Chlamydiota bacterium]
MDRQQNFWQLASIQSAAQAIPSILIGGILAEQYGSAVAFTSICVGNLILWVIGLCVISMAAKSRTNAIENVKGYLGKFGGTAMSLTLALAFIAWYMLEIQSTTDALKPFFKTTDKWDPLFFGSVCGVVIAILSRGGIRLIKWFCTIAFPFLLCFVLYAIWTSAPIAHDGLWGFSFLGIISAASLTLPGMVNLPTFFRHARSRADSIIALMLLTVFNALFQIFSIYTRMTLPSDFFTKLNAFPELIIAAFAVLLLLCTNLVNIYFASACIESITQKISRPNGYLLVGIVGTAAYACLRDPTPVLFLENLVDNFIANLGVVLLISYLVGVIVKHRPRQMEKAVSNTCWGIGCLLALIAQVQYPDRLDLVFTIGVSSSVFSFLCVLFIEETLWSFRKLRARNVR